jgi:hypothetical protein
METTWFWCIWSTNHRHLERITRWLLLFLEYEFIIVYKLGKTHHVLANALSRLLDCLEPLGVLDQIVNASLFSIEIV